MLTGHAQDGRGLLGAEQLGFVVYRYLENRYHAHIVHTPFAPEQAKSVNLVRMRDRLQKLKEALVLEWGELAETLGVSRSMLDQVRSGARTPGPKLLRAIQGAEHRAGLSPEPLIYQQRPSTPMILREADGPAVGSVPVADLQALEKGLADLIGQMKALSEQVDAMQKTVQAWKKRGAPK